MIPAIGSAKGSARNFAMCECINARLVGQIALHRRDANVDGAFQPHASQDPCLGAVGRPGRFTDRPVGGGDSCSVAWLSFELYNNFENENKPQR